MFFRKLAIRILFPLTWRPSPRRTAAGLSRFAVTELDSAWQILYAMDDVDAPHLRGMMLQHALEELHHSSEFARIARRQMPAPPTRLMPPREPLYDRSEGLDGLATFVAYAHVGEIDVFDQFSSYAAGIGDGEARGVFHEAKLDERGHVGLTREILVELVGERAARGRIRQIRLRRVYEAWLRFSKVLGEVPSGALLGALYLIFGALLQVPLRRRLRFTGPPAPVDA